MGRYLAFISYRHKEPDQHVSRTILRGIEGYHLPAGSGLPLRRRVFRDTDELPTGIDLGANIEGALDESEWLIALCSKDYMKSNWCLMEVQHFLKAGRKDRILPVLLSDTPEVAMPEEIAFVCADSEEAFGSIPYLYHARNGFYGPYDEVRHRRSASAYHMGGLVWEYRESAREVPEDLEEQLALAEEFLQGRTLTERERKTYLLD